jgi:hypothetical protein
MILINGRENPEKLTREDVMAMLAEDTFQIDALPLMQFEEEYELELVESKPGRLIYEGLIEECEVRIDIARIPDDRCTVAISVTSPDGMSGFGSI